MLPSFQTDSIDYYQKKAYLTLLQLKRAFTRLPEGKRLLFFLIILTLFLYPGQNYWQTLSLNPTQPKVKAANITLNQPLPPQPDQTPPPRLTAQAVFVFEPDSGTILHQINPDTRLHPASTTKIMTALTALDVYSPNDILTVKTGDQAIGQSVHLETGQQFTAKDLLYAILVASGNDAALTLAENYPDGGYSRFVELMNQKAKDLHLKNTSFTNVSGIEGGNHKTTVHDLAILTKEAINNPLFMEIVNTPQITITDTTNQTQYKLETTNQLLGKIEGLKGIKTGWTENAGECLITYVERNNKKIITVVLNSSDRFGETKQLIDWVYSHHAWPKQ